MSHIGGASPASSNCILTIPSIALNIGKMDHMKMLPCNLGYVFILGYSSSGHSCPEDGNLFGNCRIMVIYLNGVFELCVKFC
jgi:hypothetical protein